MQLSGRKHIFLGVALSATMLWSGCSRPMEPTPSATASISASSTPAVTATSAATDSAAIDQKFQEITEEYQAQTTGELGYPLVEPLLAESKIEQVAALNFDDPKTVQEFKSNTVPLLKKSFSAATFFPKERLLEGESQVNYRGLRSLVTLVGQLAEKSWDQGQSKEALELSELPLSLARAIKSRPETVSVNLFSSSYADTTLTLYSEWAEKASKDPKQLGEMLRTLVENQVPLAHLQQTVTVDFAKLQNSLTDEQSLAHLGIGRADLAAQDRWKKQVQGLYQAALMLYQLDPQATDAFNREFNAADGPIQGLVIDYPHMATIQLHYFARYRSIRLGLALLGPQGKELKKLDSQALVKTFFADSPEEVDTLNHLIDVKIDGEAIRIVGQPGRFDLLAPGEPPVFFEYAAARP